MLGHLGRDSKYQHRHRGSMAAILKWPRSFSQAHIVALDRYWIQKPTSKSHVQDISMAVISLNFIQKNKTLECKTHRVLPIGRQIHTLAVKLFHYASQLCSISSSQLTGPLPTLKEVEGWLQHERMKCNR